MIHAVGGTYACVCKCANNVVNVALFKSSRQLLLLMRELTLTLDVRSVVGLGYKLKKPLS